MQKQANISSISNNITQNLLDWFLLCPYLEKQKDFFVDYGAHQASYTIYILPGEIKYIEDILGNTELYPEQLINFDFSVVDAYGTDLAQNMQNLGFFDELKTWMLEQNRLENFPKIAEGVVSSILPTSTQALLDSTANLGRYTLRCQLKYFI